MVYSISRIVAFSLLIFILTSCRYLGPVDGIFTKNLKSRPDSSALIGNWEIDSLSYHLVRDQYKLNGEKVKLKILKTGNFLAENFPDFVKDGFGQSIHHRLLNASGKWDLDKIEGTWNLSMNFSPGDMYGLGWMPYQLYLKNGKLVIWISLGDPDEGRRLLFKKE